MHTNKFTRLLIVFCFIDISAAKIVMKELNADGSSLAEYIKHSKWQLKNVVMMRNEVDKVPYADKIIKALSSPVMIVNSDSELSVYEVTFITFSIKRYFYYNIFKHVRVEHRARVVILWKWPIRYFKNYSRERAMVTLQDILNVMWLHQIYDVYVLVEDENSDVLVYTYVPFGETHCNEVGPPLLIDKWNSRTKRYTINKFTIEFNTHTTRAQLMRNFHGCPIKVLVKNRPPESIALMSPDNKLLLKGSGGNILSAMMKKYNFTVNIKLAEDGVGKSIRDKYGLAMSTYTAEKLIQDLRSGQYDFAFGVFSHFMYFSLDTDLSHYYMNDNYAFYVPCGTKKGIFSIWKNYHQEFSVYTWACIVFVFFLIAFTFKLIAIICPIENPLFLSFWRNVFSLWAVHVENNVETKTRTLTMRIVVMSLMFYCTIITVAYRASLKSMLLAPLEERSIESWQELDKSNFSIFGLPDMFTILKKVSGGHSTLKRLRKKFQVITNENLIQFLEEIRIKKNVAYFAPESMVSFYNTMDEEENGEKNKICQVHKIVASSPASPFLMRKGSMFIHIINKVTNHMVQTGQMKQLSFHQPLQQSRPKQNIRNDQLPSSFQQLKGAFLLLLAGLVLAAVVFVLELFCLKFKVRVFSIKRKS